MVSASWWYQGKLKNCYASEYEQEELLDDLESADFMVAQNTKFELGWLLRCNHPIHKILSYCTQIGAKAIIANRKPCSLDLNSLCEHYGIAYKESLVSALIRKGVCPSRIPRRFLLRYGDNDVEITRQLFLKQREELKELGLVKAALTRNLLTPVLAEIEQTGMFLDETRVAAVYKTIKERYDVLHAEYEEFTGGINRNSPQQVGRFLYGDLGFAELTNRQGIPIITPAGRPIVSDATIDQLRATNSRQLEFKALHSEFTICTTQLTKGVEKFRMASSSLDGGVVKFNFNQNIADTFRLSSTGCYPYKVQGQNIDRDFKPLFKARNKGWKIAERDYAQLEFRTAIHLTADPNGIRDISEGVDVHTRTAAILTESKQRTDRQGAKEHTFKPLFGGTSGTKAERKYYEWFKEYYATAVGEQNAWVDEALKTGKTVCNATGQYAYWPHAKVHESGYISFNEAIRNWPIQYLSGELVQVSVVITYHLMKALKLESFIGNTIHDSIITELKPEEEQAYIDLTNWSTLDGVNNYYHKLYGWNFIIPIESELSVKDYWSDSDKWKQTWLK